MVRVHNVILLKRENTNYAKKGPMDKNVIHGPTFRANAANWILTTYKVRWDYYIYHCVGWLWAVDCGSFCAESLSIFAQVREVEVVHFGHFDLPIPKAILVRSSHRSGTVCSSLLMSPHTCAGSESNTGPQPPHHDPLHFQQRDHPR